MLRDGAKKRTSSARTDRGNILNLMAVRPGLGTALSDKVFPLLNTFPYIELTDVNVPQ
jgi:hypothetical protein